MRCSQRLRLSAGAAALVAALACCLVLPCSAAAARLQVSARKAQRLNAADFHAGVAAGMQQLKMAAAATSGSGAFALATAAGSNVGGAGSDSEATSGTTASSDLHAGAAASMQQILEYVAASSLASADAGDAAISEAADAARQDAEADLHAGLGMTMRGLAKLVSARAAAAGRLPVRQFATATPGTTGLDAGVAASMQQLRELAVSQSDLATAAERASRSQPVYREHIPAQLMQ